MSWFGSKSSAVCHVLFCLAASSSWPALVASLLSCGSDVTSVPGQASFMKYDAERAPYFEDAPTDIETAYTMLA